MGLLAVAWQGRVVEEGRFYLDPHGVHEHAFEDCPGADSGAAGQDKTGRYNLVTREPGHDVSFHFFV